MSDDKRKNQRIQFNAPAIVHAGKGDWHGELLDISLQGVLIRTPFGWQGEIGDECTVDFQLGNEVVVSMSVKIAHIEADYVGMHCEHIDIDSATHLRRLVELNLGDEKLLNREFAALQRDE